MTHVIPEATEAILLGIL